MASSLQQFRSPGTVNAQQVQQQQQPLAAAGSTKSGNSDRQEIIIHTSFKEDVAKTRELLTVRSWWRVVTCLIFPLLSLTSLIHIRLHPICSCWNHLKIISLSLASILIYILVKMCWQKQFISALQSRIHLPPTWLTNANDIQFVRLRSITALAPSSAQSNNSLLLNQ